MIRLAMIGCGQISERFSSRRRRARTFDLECSLRRLVDGDWIGNEAPAPSTPSNNPRRRY